MELKRCTVIDMRWKRKLGSWLSPERDAILQPSSKKKAIDDSFNGPSVSAAIGWNGRPVCTVLLLLMMMMFGWHCHENIAGRPNSQQTLNVISVWCLSFNLKCNTHITFLKCSSFPG